MNTEQMTREEAIEVIKRTKGAIVYTEKEKEALETLIPELAESEEERIRKHIIAYLRNELHNIKQLTPTTTEMERWLAYLEKQREQKPADELFPPLEGLDAIKAKYYDNGFKNGFDEGVNSVKPSEEQMEALESAVKLYKDTHFEIHHKKIVSLYEQLKKLM